MNIKRWMDTMYQSKKAFPILSFPCVQLLNISVRDLIASADMQAKGMEMIAKRLDSAAAVSMMDLSVEAEAFGSIVRFSEHEVPTVIGALVSDEEEAENLSVPAVGAGRTGLYIEAIRKACTVIRDRPVFAGVIGPYSLGGRLLDVSEIMVLCYDEPDMVHTILRKATDFLIDYIRAYRDVGANGVVVAEPLAGLLSPGLMEEFAAPYMKEIVDAVQTEQFAVIYHNCGNAVPMLTDEILSCGAMAYHFGNAVSMKTMLSKMPEDVLVMGNLDPVGELRNGTPESVYQTTTSLLEECSSFPNFVISTGCDVPPMAKWENIDAFMQAVSDFYAK